MSNVTPSLVSTQASPESIPSVPAWFGEVTLIARHLEQQGVLSAASEKVRQLADGHTLSWIRYYRCLGYVVGSFPYCCLLSWEQRFSGSSNAAQTQLSRKRWRLATR